MMTTVDIPRTIQSETTKTVETATADRYVKSADVDNNNNNNKDIYNAQIRRGSKCAVSGQY